MNIYDSLTLLYSYVFANQDKGIKHRHIAFITWLLHRWYKFGCVEWFYSSRTTNMVGSGILNKTYYYNVINDLVDLGIISYKEGKNSSTPPMFRLDFFLKDNHASFEDVKQVIITDQKLIQYIEKYTGSDAIQASNYVAEFMEQCEITGDVDRTETEYRKHIINKAKKSTSTASVDDLDSDKYNYLFNNGET